jgi:hypothetical protein
MDDTQKEDASRPKRPYQKPELAQVQLKPEEAVLGNCKMQARRGPASANCALPGGGGPCSNSGS